MRKTPMRILAHRLIVDGTIHTLSIADIRKDDEGRWLTTVSPFSVETASTTFHSGTVEIVQSADRYTPPKISFS